MDIGNFFKNVFQSGGAKDPVCGMSVDLEKTAFKSSFQDKTYGFCSANCKETFDKTPEKYL